MTPLEEARARLHRARYVLKSFVKRTNEAREQARKLKARITELQRELLELEAELADSDELESAKCAVVELEAQVDGADARRHE